MTKDETTAVEIDAPQVWELEIDGRLHRVETSTSGLTNKAIWWVDGERIADRSSVADDNLELVAEKDHALADELGAIKARFTGGGRPRRVTHFEGDRDTASTKALIGSGGTDLDPEPGSRAARREEWAVRHPVLASLDEIIGGAGKILVPIAIAALIPILSRLLPDWDIDLPLPDLPSIPWPDIDLPSIPWPDLTVPWPDITLPGWVGTILDVLRLAWPLLLGLVIAVSEYRRRRRNAAARAERQARTSAARDVAPAEADEARDEEGEPEHGEHDGRGDVGLDRGYGADRGEG